MLTTYTKAKVGDDIIFVKNGTSIGIGRVVRREYNAYWIKQDLGKPALIRRAGEIFNLTDYKRKCLTLPSVCDIKTTKEILHDS